MLQENDAFTTEGTSEHDEDSSWGDARSEGSGVLAEWFLTVTLNFSSDGKSWVVFWLSDGNDLKIANDKLIKNESLEIPFWSHHSWHHRFAFRRRRQLPSFRPW